MEPVVLGRTQARSKGSPCCSLQTDPLADLVHTGNPVWVTSQPAKQKPRNQNSEQGVQGHEGLVRQSGNTH